MNTVIPKTMCAVLLTGHGGFEKLEFQKDVAVPKPVKDQVLIQVLAAGINNTDINTRIGWYSKQVNAATDSGAEQGIDEIDPSDASWSGTALHFPRIQGADACGVIVAVGEGVNPERIGETVLVATMQPNPIGEDFYDVWTFGADCDGGFAEYTLAYEKTVYKIDSNLEPYELASFPCAYSTAENLMHKSAVNESDTVLITGASGGVGSAAIQLAKRRGAQVIAVAGESKAEEVKKLGADRVIHRGEDLIEALGATSVDVVIDLVAGEQWQELPEILKRGGRYATAGAIAGPIVNMDVRTLYLKDLTYIGCTAQDPRVFENLVDYIERGEIKPVVAKTYPLAEIVQAQQDFLSKRYVGKLVLIP